MLKQQQYVFGDFSIVTIQPEDIEDIRKWRNQQLEILRQDSPIDVEQQKRYYSNTIWPSMDSYEPANILFTFFLKEQRIGYGGLVHLKWIDKRGELSFLLNPGIVEKPELYRACFLSFLKLISEVAFSHIFLNRLTVETFDIRDFHVGILEEFGFMKEGRFRNHIFWNGKFVDVLLHALLKDDKQFL